MRLVHRAAGGITVLLGRNARMALAVTDQVVVLSKGTIVFAGSTASSRGGKRS